MKKNLTAAFFISCWFLAAEAQVSGDSLAAVWNNEKLEDTVRLQAIQSWAWGLMYREPDSFFLLANTELDFARKSGERLWEGKALNSIGAYFYMKGDYPKAFSHFQKSLDIFLELDVKKSAAAIYSNLGLLYHQQGNSGAALDYQLKSLAINEQRKDSLGIAGDYNNIAIIYQNLQEYEKALEYYEKSLTLAKKLNKDLSLPYNNIGSVYLSLENYLKALEYLQKSLDIRIATGDKTGMAAVYSNIGSAYTELGQYDKAAEFLLLSHQIYSTLGDKLGVATAQHLLGDLYGRQKKYAAAIEWCRKSDEIAREIQALHVERYACNCLYSAYKSMGNTTRALEYHERFKLLTDSLQREDLELKLNQMEFAQAILADSLDREEERLKVQVAHQTEMRKKSRTSNTILVLALILLMVALAFMSLMLYFRKSSGQFQLKAEQLEKQQLINEIALLKTQINPHFLFNSLSILSSLVRVDPDLSEKFVEQLSRSYRYILEQRDQSLVTLRTELEFIYSYAFLLKIRFENKFDIIYELSEQDLDRYKIAPLTLQLLIENAVKHNKMSVKEPLHIIVSTHDGMLVVRNQLQARSTASHGTGMGLENIKNSYALLTDRPVLAGKENGDFVVSVPLLA